MKQNYTNHTKFYAPHHFIFLPLLFGLMILGIYKGLTSKENHLIWWLFAIMSFCILYLTLMLRQHYALGNQDRIVRLEFRLRYFELIGASAKTVENKLSFAQIAALRFAEDQEFESLLNRALDEKLSSKQIKLAIQNWQGDYMRV